MAPFVLVITSFSMLSVAVGNRVVAHSSSVWLVSLGGLRFGTSPERRDVYFKHRAVDFHSFTSSVVFHEDGRSLLSSATRVPERKVPTFSLYFVQGSVCQKRKQLSGVFSKG